MRRASPNAIVRNEADSHLSKVRSVQNQAEPYGSNRSAQESTKEAPPPTSGDSASFVRVGSEEKLSLPRRTQPESAHARERRQPGHE